VVVVLAGMLLGTGLCRAADDGKPTLCVGNYQSEADAVRQLERFAATYSNLDEWNDRAAKIRQQILTGAKNNDELCDSSHAQSPLRPQQTPLHEPTEP